MKRLVDDELLRQALYVIDAWERDCDYSLYGRDRDDAITALRAALEQPAAEPAGSVIAWRLNGVSELGHGVVKGAWIDGAPSAQQIDDICKSAPDFSLEYAYKAPQAQQPVPVQEPVAVHQVRLDCNGYWKDIAEHELQNYPSEAFWETRTMYTAPQAQPAPVQAPAPCTPKGWLVQVRPDSVICISAPNPRPGESTKTCCTIRASDKSDLAVIMRKYFAHALEQPAPQAQPRKAVKLTPEEMKEAVRPLWPSAAMLDSVLSTYGAEYRAIEQAVLKKNGIEE